MAVFGETLRRERELRGISLQEIAEATNISIRFLQALEQDRFDILPGGLFSRAFLRQYASHLSIDGERFVTEFLSTHAADDPETTKGRSRWFGLCMALFLVLATLSFSLWFWMGQRTGARSTKVMPVVVPLPVLPLPADRVYPPPPAGQQGGRLPEGLVLTLSAQQNCWVVAEVDGQTVLNRVLSAGEEEVLEAQGQIILSVGNAGGLALSVNDRQGVFLGRKGEVRRNIVITKESLPTLIENSSSLQASRSS